MSTARVFRGTRVLLEAAKAATKPSPPPPSSSSSAASAAAAPKKKPPTAASTSGAGGAAASRSKSATAAAKSKPKPKRAPPSPNSGAFKLIPVSPALNDFLGVSECSRSDAIKKVWEHIKLNNLQNPANKTEIYCDDKLKTLFKGRDKVGMMEIAVMLTQHFVKTD